MAKSTPFIVTYEADDGKHYTTMIPARSREEAIELVEGRNGTTVITAEEVEE